MTLSEYKKIDIPNTPGVYFFKNKDEILYIGKATNLAHRTASYFQKKLMETRGPLIVKMVEDTTTLEWKETDSALEALLLESYLIKQHQPAYNSKEKDNKSYNYVVITNEDLPRIFTMRQRSLNILLGSKEEQLKHVFGPFPSREQLTTALGIIRKIFPFLGKKTSQTHNIEFYRQLGLAPDARDDESKNVYQKNVEYIAHFFKGEKKALIRKLKKDMMKHADKLEFERAQIIKKQIYSLNHIHDIALLKHNFDHASYLDEFRIEAYDIAHLEGESMVGVMCVYNGVEIDSSEHRVFTIRSVTQSNDTAALFETVSRRLTHKEWAYPNIIVVDGGVAQKRAVEKALREHNVSIPVIAVVKDERHKARELLGQNKISSKYAKEIVALNAESHRFAIKQHRRKRDKNFIND